ncbi:MAG: hypothetical protein WDZ88_00520 [Candidatus Paceibacterota bacterium]
MKKIIMMVTLLVTLSASALFGRESLSMIRSQDALRTYAIEIADVVGVSVRTAVSNNGSSVSRKVLGTTTEGIIGTIRSVPLTVTVTNPDDPVFLYASVSSSNGHPLFSGSKSFKLDSSKGVGYVLPKGYGDVVLRMEQNIPITMKGVRHVAFYYKNEEGEVVARQYLTVSGNQIFFPSRLAGKNAILVAHTEEGVYHWDVATGTRIFTEKYDVSANSSIEGITTVFHSDFWVEITTQGGVGKNTTVEFITAQRSGLVNGSFYTSEGRWFTGAYVRKAGTTEWVHYPALYDSQSVYINFSVQKESVYYVIPEWKEGDLIDIAFSGGGKG